MSRASDLPDDVEQLKQLLRATMRENEASPAALIAVQLINEKLRFQIASLKRARYGRSSEKMDETLAQLSLTIEDLEASHAALPPALQSPKVAEKVKPVRRPLPATLPREPVVHAAACACPECGGSLRAAAKTSPKCSSGCRAGTR